MVALPRPSFLFVSLVVAWVVAFANIVVVLHSERRAPSTAAHHHITRTIGFSFDLDSANNSRWPLWHGATLKDLVAPYGAWAHGHWLHVHHTDHGSERVLGLVDDFLSRGIPVDAVVLDYGWWSPRNAYWFHSQHYPNPRKLINDLHDRHVRVLLWTSALVPLSTAISESAANAQLFFTSGGKPTKYVWEHADGPATEGFILDVTSSEAQQWLLARLEPLLSLGIDGVRLAGVDALLEHGALGAHEFVTKAAFAQAYYHFFLDAGRNATRSTDFLVMTRAVDSFQRFMFQAFAPNDIAFAAFVGDHPFTFAGLRESMMNVIHSSYAGYISIGTIVGGTVVDAPNPRHVGHSVAESHPLESAGAARERELYLRWTQVASWLPFLCNGRLGERMPLLNDSALLPYYRRSVAVHRMLTPYFASIASSAFYTALQRIRKQRLPHRAAPTDGSWVVRFLARPAVQFSEPLQWDYLLGDRFLVIPVMYSFGKDTPAALVDFPATVPPYSHVDDDVGEAPPADRCSGPLEWTKESNPQLVFAGGSTATFPFDNIGWEPQLVFRRRGEVVPFLDRGAAHSNATYLVLSVDNPATSCAAGCRECGSSIEVPSTSEWPGFLAKYSTSPVARVIRMSLQYAIPEVLYQRQALGETRSSYVVRALGATYCETPPVCTCESLTCAAVAPSTAPRPSLLDPLEWAPTIRNSIPVGGCSYMIGALTMSTGWCTLLLSMNTNITTGRAACECHWHPKKLS